MSLLGPNEPATLRERRVQFERGEQDQAVQTEEGNIHGRRIRVSNRCMGITLTVSMVGASLMGALSSHWVHNRLGCMPEDQGNGCAYTRDAFNFCLMAAGASGILGLAACKVRSLAEGLGKIGEKVLFVEH